MNTVLRRIAIAALLVLGFGAAGLVCQRVGARGRYAVDYSTYGAGPTGTKGLYLLTEELGANPRRWAEDLGRLPEGGMLVALGNCRDPMLRDLSRVERETLLRWVESGGVLMVAGIDDYVTREGFGVELVGDREQCTPNEGLIGMFARARRGPRKRADDPPAEEGAGTSGGDAPQLEDLPGLLSDDPSRAYEELAESERLPEARAAVGVDPPLLGAPFVGMREPLELRVADEAAGEHLLRLDGPDGRPVAVRVPVGRGAVVALASASPFQNRDLAAQNGGVLFARLVRTLVPQGPVLFDEYHLGVGQRRSLMRYLRQAGAGPLVVQILLLVAVAVWRLGARFGSALSPPAPELGGTASYVEGVALLYAKAKDPPGAARILVRRALSRIGAHHHLDSRDPRALADALEARGRREAAQAVRAIAGATPRRRGPFGLPRFADELDALLRRAVAEPR